MALGLALTGLTHRVKGKKLWTLKTVTWWDEMELIKDRRFKKLDLGPDKPVYEAILAGEEIGQLHFKYKKQFLAVFEDDPLESPHRQERIKLVNELENKLKNPKLHFVSVWIFDWDY